MASAFPYYESSVEDLAKTIIVSDPRSEGHRFHFFDIGKTIFCKHLFVNLHIDDLAGELPMESHLYSLKKLTLKDERKFSDIGSIDKLTSCGRKSCHGKFINLFA